MHNLQGDIVAILDSTGSVVIEYKYDAWGRQIDCTFEAGNNAAEALSTLNPFRYRGYVYDEETAFYYVISRYYAPKIERFLSPDVTEVLSATPTALTNRDLYVYCDNNPVVRVDHNGQFGDYLVDAGFIALGVTDVIKEPGSFKNWAALVVDVVLAVVPFVPSGVGQVIKAGNKIDNALEVAQSINKVVDIQSVAKVTMVGRNMERVTNTANLIGKAEDLYDAWKGYDAAATGIKKFLHNSISMAHNGSWLFTMLRQGYTVIDIGLSTMHKGKGLWYGTETFVMRLWENRNVLKLLLHCLP